MARSVTTDYRYLPALGHARENWGGVDAPVDVQWPPAGGDRGQASSVDHRDEVGIGLR